MAVTYTITVSDLEDQVLRRVLNEGKNNPDPADWLRMAIKQKVITSVNRWINKNTKYRASRLTRAEKIQIVRSVITTPVGG